MSIILMMLASTALGDWNWKAEPTATLRPVIDRASDVGLEIKAKNKYDAAKMGIKECRNHGAYFGGFHDRFKEGKKQKITCTKYHARLSDFEGSANGYYAYPNKDNVVFVSVVRDGAMAKGEYNSFNSKWRMPNPSGTAGTQVLRYSVGLRSLLRASVWGNRETKPAASSYSLSRQVLIGSEPGVGYVDSYILV